MAVLGMRCRPHWSRALSQGVIRCWSQGPLSSSQPSYKNGSERHLDSIYWSQDIADVVYENIRDPKKLLLELNPGRGRLTGALLGRGFKNIVGMEHREMFWDPLMAATNVSGGSFRLSKESYHMRQRIGTLSQKVEDISNPFFGVNSSEWEQDPPLNIIGHISYKDLKMYIPFLVHKQASRGFLYHFGRVQHFLFMPEKELQIAVPPDGSAASDVSYRVLLYNLFMETEALLKIPIKAFDPPTLSMKLGKGYDKEHLYLVRLAPRKDLFTSVCSEDEHHEFLAFLKRATFKRKSNRLIPTLEQWCPMIGFKLLDMGYTMMDQMDALKIEDMVEIFRLITSSPAYVKNSFQSHATRVSLEKDTHDLDTESGH